MDLLTKEKGQEHFVLGNEAIVRGALEAGLFAASTYPGTPASEIGDTLHALAPRGEYYFQYAANEKVAMEFALGPAVTGHNVLISMKHVGINVAADTLMTIAYAGVRGGMVIISADDPGCHSSQNEQDNRYYARLANVPMLEPSHPQEALEMTRFAFELSRKCEVPVIVRTTTRVNHMRAVVKFGEYKSPEGKLTFIKDPKRFSCVPGNAYHRHPALLKQMEIAKEISETTPLNFIVGEGKLGVLTSGVSYNYALDAINYFGLNKETKIFKVGMSHPIPRKKLAEFLKSVDKVLVIEELEPYLEEAAKIVAQEIGLAMPIYGKVTGHFPYIHEFNTAMVKKALASVAGKDYQMPVAPQLPPLPLRPPTLCAGCPHRATFFASKLVVGEEAIFNTDIGCYALGLLPPLNMGDILIDMGSSIASAAGFAKSTNQVSIAYMGDSTFFHGGLSPLADAVHNNHKMVLVIMDNRTTAMTGHQPHPASKIDGMKQEAIQVDIESVCRGMGVKFIETVSAFDLKAVVEVFKRAVAHDGIAVVISRGACALIDRARTDARPRFVVSHEECKFCGICETHTGCLAPTKPSTQMLRAYKRINGHPLDRDPAFQKQYEKLDVAPCTRACPADVCVQSYMVLTEGKHYVEAYNSVREFIPFPAVLGRVCDHPCEEACTMKKRGKEPVAICEIKRFAADKALGTPEGLTKVKQFLADWKAKTPARSKTVAIIGAGPAGIAAASELALRGYEVSVYEAEQSAGGLLRWGIPEYRLPRDVLDLELKLVEELGVKFNFGMRVGESVTFEELRKTYDGIFIGVGARFGAKLRIEGEKSEGVYDAIEFLGRINRGERLSIGKNIGIIGGGNAAMDAARTALRLAGKGAKVKVIYRRSEAEMPAIKEEIAEAKAEGIEFVLLTAPTSVASVDGKVTGLNCIKMELGEPDASGRRRPVPVKGSEFTMPLDSVIAAIGQQTDLAFLPTEIERDEYGLLKIDERGKTSAEKIWAAGDAVTGPSSVVKAVGAAKRAAYDIDKTLSGGKWEAARLNATEPPTPQDPSYNPVDLPAWKRERPAELAAETRAFEFTEVKGAFEEAQAIKEASRCLSCGSCSKCNACVEQFACPALYIAENGLISINDVLCNGCGDCAQLCPNGAIHPATATN